MKHARPIIVLVLVALVSLLAGCVGGGPPPAPSPAPRPPAPSPVIPSPPPPTAQMKVTALKVTPTLVLPGQHATVEASLANSGNAKGTLETILNVNGVATDSRPVSLDPGASGTARFNIVRDLAGKYDLSAGEMKASLTVADVDSYSNGTFYYSIAYPKGWKINEAETTWVEITDPNRGFLAIDSEYVRLPINLEAWSTLAMTIVEDRVPDGDVKVASQTKVAREGAEPRVEVSYSYTKAGTEWAGGAVIYKVGGFGFAAFAETPATQRDTNWPLLSACLDSLRLPPVATGKYGLGSYGVSLDLKTEWQGIETGKQMPALMMIGAGSSVTPTLFVTRSEDESDAHDYVAGFVNVFTKESGFKVESEGSRKVIGASDAYDAVFSFTRGSISARYRVLAAIRGTQAIVLTFTAQAKDYEAGKDAIEQLMGSLEMAEPKPFGVSRQDSLFLYHGQITSIDPALVEEAGDGIAGALFSGLVKLNKELKPVPDLAESWKVSPDGKTHTFSLRKNARFHDGKPVTARDVKYSWERALDPRTKSTKASTYLGDIVGARDMLAGKATDLASVKVLDDYTLEVTIDGSKPYFLDKLTYPTAFVADRANVARGMKWTDEPNGSGPFKMRQWKKDELLILEKNADFYLGPAKLQNVVFQLFAGQPMMMYERGEIDVAPVGLDDIERVETPSDPLNRQLLSSSLLDIGYFGFNITKPPFDDPKVRRAFALSVNTAKVIEVALKGSAEPAGGFVPAGVPGHNPVLEPIRYQPDQTRQLLKDSKYGGVQGMPWVTLTVYGGASPVDQAIVAMWKQNLGVEVDIEAVKDLKEFSDRRAKRDFQLFISGWVADYNDPQNFLEVLFQGGSEENTSAYSSPEVDAALKAASVQLDRSARLKAYQEIEQMILRDLPAVPLYRNFKTHVVVKPYVKGYYLGPMAVNTWTEISIAR